MEFLVPGGSILRTHYLGGVTDVTSFPGRRGGECRDIGEWTYGRETSTP